MRRHGHTNSTRPDDWGTKEKHPLYHSWGWYKKGSNIVDEWRDFRKFVEAIGVRPSENHAIRRYNNDQPLGPGNWYWREKISNKDKAKYQRVWRENNRQKVKSYDLKRTYGIDYDQYMQMLDLQNGVCAICKNKEHVLHKGEVRLMAVDHCHTTGEVRGLLCTNCNKGIGHFKDDIKVLESAINYLAYGVKPIHENVGNEE